MKRRVLVNRLYIFRGLTDFVYKRKRNSSKLMARQHQRVRDKNMENNEIHYNNLQILYKFLHSIIILRINIFTPFKQLKMIKQKVY